MAGSIANSVKVTGLSVTSLTTGSINTTTGNAFVIGHSAEASRSPATPTDNKSNSYTQLGTNVAPSGGGDLNWWVKENGAGGSGHTFTCTWGIAVNPVVLVAEVAGVTSTPVDTGSRAQGSDTSSPFTITSGAFAQADEIVLCLVGASDGASNPATKAESTGFSIFVSELDESQFWSAALASKVISATTALTPSWTSSGDSVMGLHIVGFKAAAAGGPTINTQPADQATVVGGSASFSVSATSTGGALSYQWQDDSGGSFADIAGETNATLNIGPAGLAMHGRGYRCNVTDSNGTTTSSTALLTVRSLLPVQLLPSTGPADAGDFAAWLDVRAWAGAGLVVEKWFADELSASGSTAAALAATVAAQCTATAGLSTAIALAASPAGAVTLTAALTTAIRLAAAPAGQVTLSAALTTQIRPAATASAQCTVTASLSTAIALAAAAQDVTTLTASLANPAAALQASAQAQATLTAALSTAIALAAAGQAGTTVTAALTTGIALAAAPAGQVTLGAALGTQIRAAAAVAAQTTVGAALTTSIALAAAPQCVTTVSGTLAGGAAALAASVQGGCTLAAALSTGIALVAAAQSACTVAPSITTAIALASSPAAQVTLGAALSTQITAAAAVAAQCTVTAALSTQIRLAAAPQAVTTLQASLAGSPAALAAAAQGNCTVTASLGTGVSLACSLAAQASVTALLTTQIRLAAQVQAMVAIAAAMVQPAIAGVRAHALVAGDERVPAQATETRANLAGTGRSNPAAGARSNGAGGSRSNKA